MAMAAGAATLKYVKDNQLEKHAEAMGNYMLDSLKEIQESVPELGDVRGRGLMIGVEMVDPNQPQSSNGSYPANSELASQIQRECFKRGLILEVGGRHGAVVRFLPPLIITEKQVDEVITIFRQAVQASLRV